MRYLKQNTDSYVTVGPFIDKTDGFTLEDGFTVTNISYVWVQETQDSSDAHTTGTCDGTASNDWGMAAVGHGGMYTLKIPDAVINYVGSGMLTMFDADECLAVWHEFMVVPANVWDSMMGTDMLDVNQAQYLGTACHAASEAGTACVEVVRWGGNDIAATAVNGVPKVDLVDIAGAAVSATTAQLGVNAVQINAVATTNVTTINANQGTTQPVNFAGTGASANVKSDLVSILGTVLTETAGLIAAGVKKFFNVSSPTGTINSIPDAVAGATGGIAIVGSQVDLKDAPNATALAAAADAFLNRNMATGTDSGTETVRTVRQALRFLRNKWSIDGSKVLTVTKENDTDASWTTQLGTSASAEPVVSSDPTST